MCIYMAKHKVFRDNSGRTCFYIPAFLRDKFDLQNGDFVEVDTDGKRIILSFPGVE